jgi:signal peptidase I
METLVYAALAAYVVVLLASAVVTALKAKWATLVIGLAFGPAWIFGALRLARPGSVWEQRFYDDRKRERARRLAERRRTYAAAGLTASLLVVVAFFGSVKAYRIPSASMEPTLHCGPPNDGCRGETSDRVLALRTFVIGDPAEGDIITFRIPARGAQMCGSVPGATHVSRVEEVRGENLIVRGDFREQSCDSSVWGPLPKDRVVATVVFRYWPFDRLGTP